MLREAVCGIVVYRLCPCSVDCSRLCRYRSEEQNVPCRRWRYERGGRERPTVNKRERERERESDLGRSMQGTKLTRLRAQNIATVSKSFMNTHLFSFS